MGQHRARQIERSAPGTRAAEGGAVVETSFPKGNRPACLSRAVRLALVVGVGLMAANCTTNNKFASIIDPKWGVSASPRVVKPGDPIPKGGGAYRVGKPYQIAGKTYVPQENPKNYKAVGLASWYGDDFHGRLTANGEVFDMDSIAAAHPTLPMPSYVRITNLDNRRSIIARVNDRGPYHPNRVLDVSRRTAELLAFRNKGTARVKVEYVGLAPLDGSDDRKLVATLREGGDAPMPSDSAVMVASADAAMPVRPSTMRVPSIAPPPPDRPFDIGGPELADAAPQTALPRQTYIPVAPPAQPVQRIAMVQRVDEVEPQASVPEPLPAPRAVSAPVVSTPKPAAAAAKPVIRPTGGPALASLAPVPRPAPVAAKPVAAVAAAKPAAKPAPRTAGPSAVPGPSSIAASGWVVGPQPVAGYAPASGVLTPAGSGSGLY
ncbi:septal ring lytic transglycosylase RlpA family protein [Ancylobacter lacus]|uniref:septal ring lytic transglycosylase RlpA family protein n=1 Tax=Ancylobacter lacus TaxID=2579970 RepID=UPI001BCBA15F|nr:septal ring lytic transglycosylase RlpA family protein [Ancylobacter lacus]